VRPERVLHVLDERFYESLFVEAELINRNQTLGGHGPGG
jgi:hypothetical protein